MRPDLKIQWIKDKFEDSKILIRLPIVVNTLFALFLVLFDRNNPLLWYSLSSAVVIFIIYLIYRWEEPFFNLIIIVFYLGALSAEILFNGIPKPGVAPDQEMSKGIFLDILLGIIPYVYIGLRLLVVIPLIQVAWWSNKLSKYNI
jgi:hypothetical protein